MSIGSANAFRGSGDDSPLSLVSVSESLVAVDAVLLLFETAVVGMSGELKQRHAYFVGTNCVDKSMKLSHIL